MDRCGYSSCARLVVIATYRSYDDDDDDVRFTTSSVITRRDVSVRASARLPWSIGIARSCSLQTDYQPRPPPHMALTRGLTNGLSNNDLVHVGQGPLETNRRRFLYLFSPCLSPCVLDRLIWLQLILATDLACQLKFQLACNGQFTPTTRLNSTVDLSRSRRRTCTFYLIFGVFCIPDRRKVKNDQHFA